jgi:hypothetical protein
MPGGCPVGGFSSPRICTGEARVSVMSRVVSWPLDVCVSRGHRKAEPVDLDGVATERATRVVLERDRETAGASPASTAG